MKGKRHREEEQELAGIKIVRGASVEPTPRFSAYIWAGEPEDTLPAPEPRAA